MATSTMTSASLVSSILSNVRQARNVDYSFNLPRAFRKQVVKLVPIVEIIDLNEYVGNPDAAFAEAMARESSSLYCEEDEECQIIERRPSVVEPVAQEEDEIEPFAEEEEEEGSEIKTWKMAIAIDEMLRHAWHVATFVYEKQTCPRHKQLALAQVQKAERRVEEYKPVYQAAKAAYWSLSHAFED